VLIASALIARAGGVEKMLREVLGEEEGKRAYQHVAWLDHLRHGIVSPSADAKGDVTKKGKDAVDFLRGKLHDANK
jgi:hypothetical protein